MSAALALLREGLRLSLSSTGGLKIGGLSGLEPERRQAVLEHAKQYKQAIIAELQAPRLEAFRLLQWLMSEHPGCRIHVYRLEPEPVFTLRTPEAWHEDGFFPVVFDLFLKAAPIIDQELRHKGFISPGGSYGPIR